MRGAVQDMAGVGCPDCPGQGPRPARTGAFRAGRPLGGRVGIHCPGAETESRRKLLREVFRGESPDKTAVENSEASG